jgi:hypothetical protein
MKKVYDKGSLPEIKWIENLSFDFRLWIIHYRAIDTIPFLG